MFNYLKVSDAVGQIFPHSILLVMISVIDSPERQNLRISSILLPK